mmetsp:Transcript_46673/g.107873  ORF Transcript_46673/g.107873 Transcript_46673/m.107873 type:complete len:139 (-) Transcript_46673:19-435(-)
MAASQLQSVMLSLSHLVNVLVAGAVGILLMAQEESMLETFGGSTAAAQILSCIYVSIAASSIYALIAPVVPSSWDRNAKVRVGLVLFPMQIFYKLLTLPVVADVANPVPWFNLGVTVLHCVTLVTVACTAGRITDDQK